MLPVLGLMRDWFAATPSRRLLRAAVLAGALSLVLATHVFVDVDLARVRAVVSPIAAHAGKVQVGVARTPSLDRLDPPFALITRIRNGDTVSGRFSVRVDGYLVCDRNVAGGASQRLDCVVWDWNPTTSHSVTIEGPTGQWSLDYLELATHHGRSAFGYVFLILPAGFHQSIRPAAGWIIVTWIALTGILLFAAPRPLPRVVAALYWSAATVLVLSFVLVVLTPLVSPYTVMLSAGTFLRCLCLLVAPRLWSIGRRAVQVLPGRRTLVPPVAVCVLVALVVLAAYDAVVAVRLRDTHRGNYSGFLLLAQRAFDQNPILKNRHDVRRTLVLSDGGGYDGQFMYFAIFDPFLRLYKDTPATYRDVVDEPPYRFGRIGFSLMTKIFSGDQWQHYPVTMIWLILGSLFVCGLTLALTAHYGGVTPALGGLIIFVPGFWQSVQSGLPEPIAAAMLLGGYLCLVRDRWLPAGLLFAISLLVRETGVVLVACLVVATLVSGEKRQALRLALIALAPLCLWRLYVGSILFPVWGMQAFLFQPPNYGIPFAGMIDLWATIARGEYYSWSPELARAGIWYPVVVAGGFFLALALVIRKPGAVNIAALIYASIGISLNFEMIWVHVGNGQRGTYEMFIALALCLVDVGSYPRLLRAGLYAFWAATAAYVMFAGLDAAYIKGAILSPFW